MIDRAFIDATTLLLQIVPRVFATDRLALKGGTAINLYLDDAPRLSVDLDLPTRDSSRQTRGSWNSRRESAGDRSSRARVLHSLSMTMSDVEERAADGATRQWLSARLTSGLYAKLPNETTSNAET
jgi:hypothetical protein